MNSCADVLLAFLHRCAAFTLPHPLPAADVPFAPAAPCPGRPACKLFVGDAACCRNKGAIAAGASLRLWLVCNRDVYLPETKCLTGEG